MRNPKIMIAGIGLAVLATADGITAASASVSPSTPVTASAASMSGTATVRTAPASVAGKNDVNGRQVTYNGHPLFTFADDQAGHVTGQRVRDFFVTTPGLAPIADSAGSAGAAATVPSRGYGY